MKTLYLIGGTMGAGKTTVGQKMKQKMNNSVFLDGDWCWDAHPFQVTEETKQMVLENICFLLNQFLRCSAYENIIFCWVMHEQSIIDQILANVDRADCGIKVISLMCSPDELRKRLESDISEGKRTRDVVERSVKRLPLYNEVRSRKVFTDHKAVDDIADEIISV